MPAGFVNYVPRTFFYLERVGLLSYLSKPHFITVLQFISWSRNLRRIRLILGTVRAPSKINSPTEWAAPTNPETVFGNTKFAIFIWCPADPASPPQAGGMNGATTKCGRRARAGIQFWRGDARRSHSEKQTVDTLSWLPYKTFQRTDGRTNGPTPNVVVCISVAAAAAAAG